MVRNCKNKKTTKKSQPLGYQNSVLLSVVSVSACQWLGLHMGQQSIVINCGYLLVTMEMPGMLDFFFFSFVTMCFANNIDIFSICAG